VAAVSSTWRLYRARQGDLAAAKTLYPRAPLAIQEKEEKKRAPDSLNVANKSQPTGAIQDETVTPGRH
jgi:hypothetical protein